MHHTEGYISYEPSNTKHIIWAINPYITFNSPLYGNHIIWSILYRSYHMWILYRYMIYLLLPVEFPNPVWLASDSSIFVEVFPSKRTKIFFVNIRTYTWIQALKCRMQALFLMQIQNLKSDFRGIDFLLFLGIKSESNQYSQQVSSTSEH